MMSLSISKISGRGSHSDTREAPDIDKATRKEVQKQNVVKIGTWNVCGLGRSGKIEKSLTGNEKTEYGNNWDE